MVVAPLPPLAFTTVKTLPRGPSRLTLRWLVDSRTKASSRSVVVVGRSINSRAPARMALTMQLRLRQAANREYRGLRQFLMQQLDCV